MICYALYSTAEPRHFRYVGATTHGPGKRLTQHLNSYRQQRQTEMRRWIRTVLESGHTLKIKVLSKHSCLAEMAAAEGEWVRALRLDGHWLFNRTASPDSLASWRVRLGPDEIDPNGKYARPSENKRLAPAAENGAERQI